MNFLKRKALIPWLFMSPALILVLVFNIYPLVESLWLSVHTTERGVTIFYGFKNYIRLLSDNVFYKSLYNSLIYLVIQVPIMLILSTMLAVSVHKLIKYGKSFFRTSFYLPVVVNSVAYSLVFVVLFQDRGAINYIFSFFGVSEISWITKEWPARIIVMTVLTWRWVGYNMVIILAGLQLIPDDYYEASVIDGATSWQQFLYITVPLLVPVILFCTVNSTIGTLNLFTEPHLITQGGPNSSTLSLGMYIFDQAFSTFNFTYASTISIAILVIVGVLSAIQIKLGDKHD